MKYWLASAILLLSITFANAATVPECQARVIVPVTDDLGNHWPAGKILPVDIARDDAKGGTFCAQGGSCIPRKVRGDDALRLVNCKIGPAITATDHRLVPDASLAGKTTAHVMYTRDEVNRKLSDLGFSNAAAASLADEFVAHPNSPNSKLVAQALAGSDDAQKELLHNAAAPPL